MEPNPESAARTERDEAAAPVELDDRRLPDAVTTAHLRYLETGEGDPWGEPSG